MLALENTQNTEEPQIGDWVVEVTHLIGMGKHSLALDCAIGKLVGKASSNYLLELRDGSEFSWENAKFLKLPQPNP